MAGLKVLLNGLRVGGGKFAVDKGVQLLRRQMGIE